MKAHYSGNQDENVNYCSCVSVDSEAGVWAVTQDMTVSGLSSGYQGVTLWILVKPCLANGWSHCPSGQVLYRDGTGHGKPGLGSAWSPGLGKMRSVAAGPQVMNCVAVGSCSSSYWCLGCLGSQQGRGGVCKDGTDGG